MFTPSAESSSGSTVWDQRVIGAVWKDADVLLTCATNRLRLLGIGRPDIDIVRGLFYKQIKHVRNLYACTQCSQAMAYPRGVQAFCRRRSRH